MTRSNAIDATAWRNIIEFDRLTIIYKGFFSDTDAIKLEIQKHKEEHRISQEDATRLLDLKKSHDDWVESYLENIKTKQK